MLVIAALRWVDPHPVVDRLTGAVRTDPRGSGPSEADRCALEHALRLAEHWSGRCVAVTAGPAQAEAMLRDALAAGADQALRIGWSTSDPTDDGSRTAGALAEGIATLGAPDVVVCGDHSLDRGTGATPAFLAARLGAAQALGLLELTVGEQGLTAVRRLDGGRRERLDVPLPAVCSVEPAGVRLRRGPLSTALAAGVAEIPVLTVDGGQSRIRAGAVRPYRPRPVALSAPAGDAHHRVLALTGALVERTPPRLVRPADSVAAADELLGYLRRQGFLDR